MRRALGMAVLAAAICAFFTAPPPARAAEPQFTTDFRLEECRFLASGRNTYFSIEPGDRFVFEGEEDGEEVRLQITVLHQTRVISFRTQRGERLIVKTRVVEEREWVDDELVEVSRNFFARCEERNDIFYFGEEVDIYEDGELVNHEGAWLAGRNGARPGLIMPGTYLLGSRYFQEVAPGVALDRAEHTAMGLTLTVPAGTFRDCVEVKETTPLSPGEEEFKHYCPRVGLVTDGPLELVSYELRERGRGDRGGRGNPDGGDDD
jgi:hypothetical protein